MKPPADYTPTARDRAIDCVAQGYRMLKSEIIREEARRPYGETARLIKEIERSINDVLAGVPRGATHTLIEIGYLGCRRVYLDIPLDEAIVRYAKAEGETPFPELIKTYKITDEFAAYAVYTHDD